MGSLTPETAAVLGAALSAVASIVVGVLNLRSQRRKFAEEIKARDVEKEKADAVRDATLRLWMESVDKKLDAHNGYAEKFSEIREDIASIKADVRNLYKK